MSLACPLATAKAFKWPAGVYTALSVRVGSQGQVSSGRGIHLCQTHKQTPHNKGPINVRHKASIQEH